ncbi:30S ribosomal protein S4 [Candidatus Peregrinibacteria bacterium]|nr:30S ribosomal protein S4 [Candidatus Peregrinibacteria bacterium]
MSRYRGPITKLSRRLGVILFANGQSKLKAYQKKNYKPGEHGQKRFSQLSEYNKQLREKQKARVLYGINEKQSKKYFDKASRNKQGITGVNYLILLERRLDNVVFRAGMANSRQQSRQMVSHGLITLNGKVVKTPSIQVKEGDNFEVREKNKKSPMFDEIKKAKVRTPRWISFDPKGLKGQITTLPEGGDIENVIDHQLITEFYSK